MGFERDLARPGSPEPGLHEGPSWPFVRADCRACRALVANLETKPWRCPVDFEMLISPSC